MCLDSDFTGAAEVKHQRKRSFGKSGRTFNRRDRVQGAEDLGMWAEDIMGGNSRLGEE